MTVSTTNSRATDHYLRARQLAEDSLRSASRLPIGLARLPHLIDAGEYWGKAWGVADLMAATCAPKQFRAWAEHRQAALDGCRAANSAIIELVRVGAAA